MGHVKLNAAKTYSLNFIPTNENVHNKLIPVVLISFICTLPWGFSTLFVQPQIGQYLLFLSFISFILLICGYYFIFQHNTITVSISIIDVLLFSFLTFGLVRSLSLKREFGQLVESHWELMGLSIIYMIVRGAKAYKISNIGFAFLFAGVSQAVFGIFQLLNFTPSNHSEFTATGSFINPGLFAGYLISVLPLSLGAYLFIHTKKYSSAHINYSVTFKHFFNKVIHSKYQFAIIVAFLSSASILFMIIVTKSRAAWLATVVSISYFIFQFYKLRFGNIHQKTKKHIQAPYLKYNGIRLLFSVLLIIIIGFASFGLYQIKKDSANGRLLIWGVTLKMIQDKPLFGHGTNGFQANYMNYQADYFKSNPNSTFYSLADNTTYAFNEFLKITSENGIIGLILILIVLFFLFLSNPNNCVNVNSFLILLSAKAGLIAIIIFGIFSYPSEILPIKINMVIFVAIIISSHKSLYFSKKNLRISGISLIVYAVFLIIYISNTYQAHRNWKLANTAYKLGAHTHCLRYFEDALPFLDNNGEFLIHFGKALSISEEYNRAIEILERAKNYFPNTILFTSLGDCYKNTGKYELAEKCYSKAAMMVPNRFYPNYLLAKLYFETGNTEMAVRIATDLLTKEIKIESLAILEIRNEMEKIIEDSKKTTVSPQKK